MPPSRPIERTRRRAAASPPFFGRSPDAIGRRERTGALGPRSPRRCRPGRRRRQPARGQPLSPPGGGSTRRKSRPAQGFRRAASSCARRRRDGKIGVSAPRGIARGYPGREIPADHVEELHSVADGQNGKAAPESAGEEARFESVPIGRRRCDRESAPFSIERGREVLSARADQSVQAVEDGRDPFDFLEGTKENREPPTPRRRGRTNGPRPLSSGTRFVPDRR